MMDPRCTLVSGAGYLCHGMESFRKLDIRLGWVVFLVVALVYGVCIEPTASFWDCGEYIACSYGIETGHPPGAPFFLLLGRFFALFSFGNENAVAPLINLMSALASAFTVLFLFWTITHLVRKVLLRTPEDYTSVKRWLVLGAGSIGALTYAFTDSFWFSAEEGEVYALSSLFTALVFWAMLKWEDVADQPHADRWLVFICYMIGLSIGVHLLNLLAIPALVFIWYFRKASRITIGGLALTSIVALALLGGIQDVLIPGIVQLAGKTEIWFVNDLGFAFNSGIISFLAILVSLVVAGLIISRRYKIYWLNTALACFTVLMIGYSSFLVLVIRSQANTPINEGNPSNPVSLLSYLNREQYGDWPLLYGPYYNTPTDSDKPYSDGDPVYVKDEHAGRYIVSDARKNSIPNYNDTGCTFFPRMYSPGHAQGYIHAAGIEGKPVMFTGDDGQRFSVNIPTFGENLKFFIGYQCGWMYLRYFGWNFIGRQNDHLGYGGETEGNVLIFPGLDDVRLGDQSLLPDSEKNSKGRNRYFLIPALLGVFGFCWQVANAKRDTLVVTLLFLFTGLAIVLYLNQTPWQPRERDYAYVGSFYAYAIWIGLSVPAMHWFFFKFAKRAVAFLLALVIGFSSPILLFAQNFDDHNRSGRTAACDLAVNMLESCDRNAILFTYADNDTFPLWYAQEVLGIRRDVRILCLSLLRSDWYIDQAKRAQYEAAPCPVTMSHWQYRDGTREYVSLFEESEDTLDATRLVQFFTSNKPGECFIGSDGDTLNYIPTRNVSLPLEKTNPADTIEKNIYWRLRSSYILKDQLVVLDILAHNNWKRPICFAVNMPGNCYAGLDEYLRLEGLVYRLVPEKNSREEGSLFQRPNVNLGRSYKLAMQTFRWGGLSDLSVNTDETVLRMFVEPVRSSCARVAVALAEAGRTKEAQELIRKCVNEIPATQAAPDDNWMELVNAAYLAGDNELASELSQTAFAHFYQSLIWYRTLAPRYPGDYSQKQDGLIVLLEMADGAGDKTLAAEYRRKLKEGGFEVPPVLPPMPAVDSLRDTNKIDSLKK
jgi:hypothetical protein